MQASVTMLESTLGKLLSAKQVETSNDINSEEAKLRKKSSNSASSKPEAEVRLVVKFTVEEQIVFNGKIERVNQLESEELTRVVSRVAWDDSEVTNPIVSSEERAKEAVRNEPTDEEFGTQDNSTKSVSITDLIVQKPTFDDNDTVNGPDELSSNTVSSDHLASVKASSDSPRRSDISPAQKSKFDSTEDDRISCRTEPTSSDCNPDETTIDCDNDPKRIPDQIYEVGADFSPNQLHSPKEASEHKVDTNLIDEGIEEVHIASSNLAHDTNIDAIESQTVTDTLNDCVNNVDIECRLQLERANHSNCKTAETLDRLASAEIKLGPKQFEREVVLEHSNTGFPRSTEDQNQPRMNGSASAASISDDTKPRHRGEPNDNESTHNRPRDEAASAKRRSPTNLTISTTDQNSSGKRIRKASAKEQKCSSSKSNPHQTNESQLSRRSAGSPSRSNLINMSLLANNHQARQSKIFARWSDNHFYPGTIVKPARDRKFVISFFDGAQRNVSETDLIPLRNIEGKQVRVSIAKNYCVNAIVHDQRSPINDQPMFDVEYQQDGLVRRCVPLKDIFLTGEQGTPLIDQPDRNPGVSNFADVDLDNIIYEKRSRRFQEMEDYELTENSSLTNKRKRGQYNMRNTTPRGKTSSTSAISGATSPSLALNNEKSTDLGSNSNPPSEGSSSTGSSNIPNVSEMGHDFYFTSSSPHRTKTSLLL